MEQTQGTDDFRKSELPVVLLPALLALAAQIIANIAGGYGIFRDELYYLACSRHLDWGYVDQPSLSILLLGASRFLLGDSLVALRFLPAVAGASTVLLAGLIARQLGGKSFAQVLASVSVAIAPVYLAIFNFYSMNSFDLFFWTLSFYIVVRIFKTGKEKLWIVFGLTVGLALENKFSILFFCFGLFAAMLLSPYRKYFLSKWFWLGGLVAFLLFVPHLLWQMQHGWPTLEFMRNASSLKNAPISAAEFLLQQILLLHPLNVLIWLPGLIYLLLSSNGRPYRLFAVSYFVILAVFVMQHGKPYYLSPFYTMLFAAGAVAIEMFAMQTGRRWVKPAVLSMLLVGGVLTAPFALPVLPVETFIRYAKLLGLAPRSEERDRPGKLGQHYADMFGWKEMAADVAAVYGKLPAEEKSNCVIFAQNYGEAGAIDFFGKDYGLPSAFSSHNSYWYWGPPKSAGRVVIIIGSDLQGNLEFFDSCEQQSIHQNEYARSFETDLPIFVCRGPKRPIAQVWPQLRRFI